MKNNICLAVPTRGRPANMVRMFNSFIDFATNPNSIEVVFYIDDDDDMSLIGLNKLQKKYGKEQVRAIIGPRITLSQTHTECYKQSDCELVCYTGDDVVVESIGYDNVVRNVINSFPAQIALITPRDGYNEDTATTGFLHRNWVETTGYVTPPYFGADWADKFLTDVAKSLGVFVRIAEMIRHYHPAAMPHIPVDNTMSEKIARGNAFGNGQLYYSEPIQSAVRQDIQKLQKFINERTA